jgi:WD40 repeat protein
MGSAGLFWARAVVVFLPLVWATAGVAWAQDAGQRDLARVRLEEEEPSLRIEAGGHTASVEALAFTPDSVRLCSAGLDKAVQVWNLHAISRDLRRVVLRERTLRWQVARGLRGSIYALASSPSDGLLAIGGYGAMGSLGEILLLDPLDGSLRQVLEHHRQTICSLAFSADGTKLASLDTAGAAVLWQQRGPWQPVVLYDPDERTYGPEKAKLIARQPKLRPIVILGNSHVVLPLFVGGASDNPLRWRLARINVADLKDFRTFDTVHSGMVSALAASRDGSRLASADLAGNLYLWDAARGVKTAALRSKAKVLSLCFSPDGRTLAAGTAVDPDQGTSRLQIWDTATRTLLREHRQPDHIRACVISPDGKQLAYVGGKDNEVFVEALAGGEKAVALRGRGQRILKVAFAKEIPLYRIAFGTQYRDGGFNDYADLQESFDTTRLALEGGGPLKPADWLPSDWSHGGWTAQRQADGTLQLFQNNLRKGTVVLAAQVPGLEEGAVRCYCWLPDRQGNPFGIVVGTDAQNSVYLCRLAEQGPCPILRHFRGHNDYVTSLGVSRDLRYVVSGSADGTVMLWSLADCQQGAAPEGRWGAGFAVQGDRLVAVTVHPAGPLFRKGLRQGDVVSEIRWPAGQSEQSETRPAVILQKLREVPWGTQVLFEYSRQGVARPAFQLLPAWQPLATLFVSTEREWAFWTPEGYYDASFNGFRLFGWQVNRGRERLPDFYRADQFFRKLERPDVLERLLPAGSLQDAFRQAAAPPPAEIQEVLSEQIAATPRVEVLSPRPGSLVRESSTRVRARVQVPADRKLVQAKAFANGLVATRRELISERETGKGKELTYEWEVPLPTDQRNLIQVIVGTDLPTAAFGDVLIERPPPAPPPRPPKLYILAAGINKYSDPDIQSLNFSVADAEAVVKLLRERSKGLYVLDEPVLLTENKVTPETWQKTLKQLAEKLQELAQPDDLLIFFLAGHGIVDEETQKYYFVGHDFKLADYEKGAYAGCICWDDFRGVADLPCRKLALLDTCHSGAIQPPRSRDLKKAVRDLQGDVIFTVTASTGEQRSAEKEEWRHGAFTKCLLEALEGRADVSRQGVVTLNEMVAYVKQSVEKLTEGIQTPTAAPDEILPFTSLPLTRVSASGPQAAAKPRGSRSVKASYDP